MPEKSDVGSVLWARKIDPKVELFTKEYEKLLKNEYFKFVKSNSIFFIKVILAKIFIIILYFVIFCNYGVYVLFKYSHNKESKVFYPIGLLLFSSIGIATEPIYNYMLGFFVFSSLFTLSLLYNRINDKKYN